MVRSSGMLIHTASGGLHAQNRPQRSAPANQPGAWLAQCPLHRRRHFRGRARRAVDVGLVRPCRGRRCARPRRCPAADLSGHAAVADPRPRRSGSCLSQHLPSSRHDPGRRPAQDRRGDPLPLSQLVLFHRRPACVDPACGWPRSEHSRRNRPRPAGSGRSAQPHLAGRGLDQPFGRCAGF